MLIVCTKCGQSLKTITLDCGSCDDLQYISPHQCELKVPTLPHEVICGRFGDRDCTQDYEGHKDLFEQFIKLWSEHFIPGHIRDNLRFQSFPATKEVITYILNKAIETINLGG